MTEEQMRREPYTLTVGIGGAVHFIANPKADPRVEWMLRYSPEGLDDKCNSVRLAAASILDGFDYLISTNISMKEATRRLRVIRAARLAACQRLNDSRTRPVCKICNGTGLNHGAQPGPGPGYKTIDCECKEKS